MSDASWIPTRKWLVTQITAATALVGAWVGAVGWDRTLTIALIGLISQAAVSYLTPNGGQPDGPPSAGDAPATLAAASAPAG